MKKYLYTFAFLLIGLTVQAQADTLVTGENPAYGYAVLDDPTTSPGDIAVHVDLIANGTDTRTYVWERSVISLPSGWRTAVCDLNICHLPQVGTEQFAQTGGDTSEIILHVYPGGSPGNTTNATPGTAEVHVRVYESANPSNEENIIFFVTLDATTGTTQLEVQQLKVYPNPTQDVFRVSENTLVKRVKVLNIVGKTALDRTIQNGEQLSVAHLKAGMYLVQMFDNENQVVKTVRLLKE